MSDSGAGRPGKFRVGVEKPLNSASNGSGIAWVCTGLVTTGLNKTAEDESNDCPCLPSPPLPHADSSMPAETIAAGASFHWRMSLSPPGWH